MLCSQVINTFQTLATLWCESPTNLLAVCAKMKCILTCTPVHVEGHCIPFQQADGHHHLDYVQNIYVNWSLYKRSFNEAIIFFTLWVNSH